MLKLEYYPLLWIDYHASAILIIGVPILLTGWALGKREKSIIRLLEIYWKTSSLLPCIMLFPPQQYHIVYLGNFIAKLLMILSLWFWIDLNEELAHLPSCGGLTFVIRSWRWTTSFFCIGSGALSATALNCCINNHINPNCEPWLEISRSLYRFNFEAFGFIFGGYWNASIPLLIGSVSLSIYVFSFLHWVVFTLPYRGRIAGNF
ncbi:hypothetical protein PMYN1_Chma472 (chromatophore) [Paulinella micropora]|uniref:Uncharacterized protein n=1 Tax=Paulinella micropora TaxID=1928728 RepID=A0A1L5YC66_9EUKA|nr:hypothetical protein PCKR_522 [Paulinella micropora]AQX45070.1 hypothetical protein PFK_522 [Paulinella micropora]BBL86281.1 hypothetical protein PMYN1_Chma472 [Paulinella micropora]